jgi:hypothetical protein
MEQWAIAAGLIALAIVMGSMVGRLRKIQRDLEKIKSHLNLS